MAFCRSSGCLWELLLEMLCGCGFSFEMEVLRAVESCEQPRWQAGHLCSSDGWLRSAQVPAASWCHPATLVPSPPAHTAPATAHSGAFLHRVMCISLPPSLCNPPGVLCVQVDPSHCWAAPVLPPAALSRYRCGRPLSSPLCPRTVMQSHLQVIFHTTSSL